MNKPLALQGRSLILSLLLGISLVSMVLIANPRTAEAQASLSQCNGTDNAGGQAVECHYTITNEMDGDVTSSTVTIQECHGAANDPPTLVCTSSTTTSTDLVTSVDQCNGSGSGGGGTVTCTVDVTNNLVADVSPTAATVNQCNSSGLDGGTEPTVLCDPFPANTTGADVTQCNGSGNGGGGTQRVRCTVDTDSTTTSVLEVTVNQCNGSGNGGGATVTCRTGITNNITAPPEEPEPSTSPDDGPGGDNGGGGDNSGGGGDNSGGGGDNSGGGGDDGPLPRGPLTGGGGAGSAGNLDAGGATPGQVTRIPRGGAAAGGGPTGAEENTNLLLLGLFLLALAGPVLLLSPRAKITAYI